MPLHRKRIKHFHDPGDVHEFTFSCYQRRPLLTDDRWRGLLSESVNAACEQFNFQLIAFVFMPEHVHLMTLPIDHEPAIDRFLAAVKRPVSVRVKGDLIASNSALIDELTVRERPGKSSFRYWQEGPGYDRNLRTAKTIIHAIEYIHANPVRRGLCRAPEDWLWSSARWFASDALEVDARLPRLTRLPAEFGWQL